MPYASYSCDLHPLDATKSSRNRLVKCSEAKSPIKARKHLAAPIAQLLLMTKAKLSYALLNSTENKLPEAQGRAWDSLRHHYIIFYFLISSTRQVYLHKAQG